MLATLIALMGIGSLAQSASSIESRTLGPRTSYGGVVADRPIIARFAETDVWPTKDLGPLSEMDVSGTLYRDSLGRTRTELVQSRHDNGREMFRFLIIVDPVLKVSYMLDSSKKVAMKLPLPVGEPTGWVFPGSSVEELGKEVVEGVECRHARVTTTTGGEPSFMQVWISEDLKVTISERAQSTTETYTWRVTDIRRDVPDASLFVVPQDYKIISAN
jgi:Domain of unknown function (DUF4412)